MTTTLAQESTNTRESHSENGDICAELARAAAASQTPSAFYRAAFRLVAEHFRAPYATISVTQLANSLNEQFHNHPVDSERWGPTAEAAMLECQATKTPVARLYEIDGTSAKVAILSAVIRDYRGHAKGAMSLVAACETAVLARAYLAELQALVAFIGSRAAEITSRRAVAVQGDEAVKRALGKSADFESLHEMAFAITNGLKNKFGCSQVAFGLVRNRRVRILAISGLDSVNHKSPGIRQIRQAMDECIDCGKVICLQAKNKWSEGSSPANYRLHEQWHQAVGKAPVVSIPLYCGDRCVAVVSATRNRDSRFTQEELDKLEDAVSPFAPAIVLVAKATRGLLAHATGAAREATKWLVAPRSFSHKLGVAVLLASLAVFCFASANYNVTIPSKISPTEVRYFSAPFEGTIAACHARIGDDVQEGQLLYELDTTNLELRRDELLSELAILGSKTEQALATENVRLAALTGTEIDGVRAELAIVQRSISCARVHAPISGTVVEGSLERRIGEVVPMGAPLMKLVPHGNWSVELFMPESMRPDVREGTTGLFASNARPDEPLSCRIARIRPSSELIDGENVFVAEAVVEHNPDWMRAGMEGVARMNAGKRFVWWIALHRVIDNVRLAFWI